MDARWLLLNRVLVFLARNQYTQCENHCEQVLMLDPSLEATAKRCPDRALENIRDQEHTEIKALLDKTNNYRSRGEIDMAESLTAELRRSYANSQIEDNGSRE